MQESGTFCLCSESSEALKLQAFNRNTPTGCVNALAEHKHKHFVCCRDLIFFSSSQMCSAQKKSGHCPYIGRRKSAVVDVWGRPARPTAINCAAIGRTSWTLSAIGLWLSASGGQTGTPSAQQKLPPAGRSAGPPLMLLSHLEHIIKLRH